MNKTGITTKEIIIAILTRDSVSDAAKRLIQRKEDELSEYRKALQQEEAFSRMLTASLDMPEGTAGRRVGDAIVAELRESYPDAAEEADKILKCRKEREAAELDRICAR